ncbi:hypothetical protein CAOG_000729 [Capsaspora owczarzaki ATCC 30864]|uniref:UmuC domain-containing protein n=1 Tax=Capsaspora owczarzaki (strain ATCC 30864) TaxID=595528 RepID=A0A0D2WHS0_CAPO3|nr:hypothetical protein CAOG_000729 [Capsaspora owczarzaki ATCC 30864]
MPCSGDIPVRSIPSFGGKVTDTLKTVGIETGGDVLRAPPSFLASLFGASSPTPASLLRACRGEDDSEVVDRGLIKSISSQMALTAWARPRFGGGPTATIEPVGVSEDISLFIRELAEDLAERTLEDQIVHSRHPSTLTVAYRVDDTWSRSRTFPFPLQAMNMVEISVSELTLGPVVLRPALSSAAKTARRPLPTSPTSEAPETTANAGVPTPFAFPGFEEFVAKITKLGVDAYTASLDVGDVGNLTSLSLSALNFLPDTNLITNFFGKTREPAAAAVGVAREPAAAAVDVARRSNSVASHQRGDALFRPSSSKPTDGNASAAVDLTSAQLLHSAQVSRSCDDNPRAAVLVRESANVGESSAAPMPIRASVRRLWEEDAVQSERLSQHSFFKRLAMNARVDG